MARTLKARYWKKTGSGPRLEVSRREWTEARMEASAPANAGSVTVGDTSYQIEYITPGKQDQE